MISMSNRMGGWGGGGGGGVEPETGHSRIDGVIDSDYMPSLRAGSPREKNEEKARRKESLPASLRNLNAAPKVPC